MVVIVKGAISQYLDKVGYEIFTVTPYLTVNNNRSYIIY